MNIKFIAIHCSDSPNERDVSAADIHRWHKEKGWDGIGYNEVITRSGEIQHGRPPYWQGAHVQDFDGDGIGDNSDSIGICLIGRDVFTDAQFYSLTKLVNEYLLIYPNAQVVGHYQLDSRKTCPNFDVQSWWTTSAKKPQQLRNTRNFIQ
ncbi:N-acetylmuramoyl-L-alanine amidase [Saccharospirillum sp. MSK14-1]|uniref:N-acetylmuramoyl-L-alanine amidase n=1 Tax=Saccharospirillum sp. MSK14-1 TaxID=1897632 RepID=UPI000D359608|nr:N-acetylmuramoyl-L-alanine amidase [Saccharospirillum sp. MSK14-1]